MNAKTILFPTDFSALSTAALQHATALALNIHAELLIVHVIEPGAIYGAGGMYYGVPAPDDVTLREMLVDLQPSDARVSCERVMVKGTPAAEIVRLAEEHDVEMIVMGTHGRTGLERLLTGSVAEAVVRQATCPVLTIKSPQARQPTNMDTNAMNAKTILFPTDFSGLSDAAMEHATALALDLHAKLLIVHVTEPGAIYGAGEMYYGAPEPDDFALRNMLDDLKPSDPRVCCEHRLAKGAPAAEIVRSAEESGAEMIVMGTHGRTGLGHFLMGSVAEAVVRHAKCPVLTVKSPHVPQALTAS